MSNAQIVAAIDAVIANALAVGSLNAIADRSIGPLSITKSTTMAQLMEMRKYYADLANADAGTGEVATVYV